MPPPSPPCMCPGRGSSASERPVWPDPRTCTCSAARGEREERRGGATPVGLLGSAAGVQRDRRTRPISAAMRPPALRPSSSRRCRPSSIQYFWTASPDFRWWNRSRRHYTWTCATVKSSGRRYAGSVALGRHWPQLVSFRPVGRGVEWQCASPRLMP